MKISLALSLASVVTAASVWGVAGGSLTWAKPAAGDDASTTTSVVISTGESLPSLDLKLIKAMKSKDHTAAVRKIKVSLTSRSSRSVVVSTYRTTTVPMTWRIKDPASVAKRIRVCVEVPLEDVDRCKGHDLSNYAKPRGDFTIRRVQGGWEVVTVPYYKNVSPASCNYFDYYRPKVIWRLVVVDPRNGGTAASAKHSWILRCSG